MFVTYFRVFPFAGERGSDQFGSNIPNPADSWDSSAAAASIRLLLFPIKYCSTVIAFLL